MIYHQDATLTLLLGDAADQLRTLPDGRVQCVVTSPPYFGLRDYAGQTQQIGLEDTPAAYVDRMVAVFAELRRVLADDGTVWLNLGDTYSSSPSWGRDNGSSTLDGRQHGATKGPTSRVTGVAAKNLLFVPERVAIALQDDGWIVRNKIVWHKPNAMPESVTDRLSTRHETLFLLTKSKRYWFNLDAIREPLVRPEALTEGIVFGGTNNGEDKVGASARRRGGDRSVYGGNRVPGNERPKNGGTGPHHDHSHTKGRNPGDVWTVPTRPLPEAHFAAFPPELPRRCIAAGCKPGGTVLDPFNGAGTTAMVAQQLGHAAIGIDLEPSYHDIALRRMADAPLPFGEVSA